MRCSGFDLEIYGFYALGTSEPGEGYQIDEHLAAGCETCAEAVSKSMDVWYSVAVATPQVKPRWGMRRKVLAPFRVSAAWWPGTMATLAFASALIAMAAVGWGLGRRGTTAPQIAYAPVYTNSLPELRAPAATAAPAEKARREVIVQTVTDPSQAKAVEALSLDLTHERERVVQLQTDLTQRQAQLAAAQDAARVADQKLRTANDKIVGGEQLQLRVNFLNSRTVELERQVTQYRVLLETQRQTLDRNTQMVAMMSDPAIRVVKMRTTEKGESMAGHALISGESKLVFFASKLPALPAGRTYQLWVVRSTGPAIVSAGTFNAAPGKQAMLQFNEPLLFSHMTTLAVTDEPTGGSALPTGHKWMIGS